MSNIARQTPVRDQHVGALIQAKKSARVSEKKRTFANKIADNEEFLNFFAPGRKDYRAAIAKYGMN